MNRTETSAPCRFTEAVKIRAAARAVAQTFVEEFGADARPEIGWAHEAWLLALGRGPLRDLPIEDRDRLWPVFRAALDAAVAGRTDAADPLATVDPVAYARRVLAEAGLAGSEVAARGGGEVCVKTSSPRAAEVALDAQGYYLTEEATTDVQRSADGDVPVVMVAVTDQVYLSIHLDRAGWEKARIARAAEAFLRVAQRTTSGRADAPYVAAAEIARHCGLALRSVASGPARGGPRHRQAADRASRLGALVELLGLEILALAREDVAAADELAAPAQF